jgi:hypothetical protein
MKLYGRQWTKRELEARTGRIDQLGGVQRFRHTEGPEAGVEQIQVRTGAGLIYNVSPDRGMDIGRVEFGGTPLVWMSPTGEPHPAYYDPTGLEWLRTAAGGLLMTCGLTQVGSPAEDGGESLGLHGRTHHTSARQVVAESTWDNDGYQMRVTGTVEETRIFGHHLRLHREIHSRLGDNSISIHDMVENRGFEPAPHMILYHFNFGFPLLSEASRVKLPSRRVIGREQDLPLEDLDRWQAPFPGFQEQVYYHEDLDEEAGWTEVLLSNPHFPFAGGMIRVPVTIKLQWTIENLPRFVQWRMPGEGTHVLGIEPANCHVGGRAAERTRGSLVTLEPGEQRDYFLRLQVELDHEETKQ